MCLNSPTLPFLITFCSTHFYTSYFYEIFATCTHEEPAAMTMHTAVLLLTVRCSVDIAQSYTLHVQHCSKVLVLELVVGVPF